MKLNILRNHIVWKKRSVNSIVLFVLSVFSCQLLATTASTGSEVKQLIEFVKVSGCYFHRNGTRHDSEGAADHLELKYNRGKKYVKTAENFIDRLATKSSWSRKAYHVECQPGELQPSGPWLHRQLDNMRANKKEDEQQSPP